MLRTIANTFEMSSVVINQHAGITLSHIESKLEDPTVASKAQRWFIKAQLVATLSDSISKFIESIKLTLKKEGAEQGLDHSVPLSFLKGSYVRELFEKLEKYKPDLLSIDQQMKAAFDFNIITIGTETDSLNLTFVEFKKIFFENNSIQSAICNVSKFENNIRLTESRMLTFCDEQTSGDAVNWYRTYPVIFQDKSLVKPGEAIQITAGIGNFIESNAEISINGLKTHTNDQQLAVRTIKCPTENGKYKIPVVVSYTDQDGQVQFIKKNVEYIVSEQAEAK